MELKYPKEAENNVERLLKSQGISPKDRLIGICAAVGESVTERQWPYFRELCMRIKGYKIILIGSDYQLNEGVRDGNPDMINLAGKLSMPEMFCIMKRFSVFVSNDTGPMHVAAAQGTRTIGLFGPNTPKIWAPLGKHNISIFHPAKGCPYLDNTRHELVPSHLTEAQKKVMENITVDEVLHHINKGGR